MTSHQQHFGYDGTLGNVATVTSAIGFVTQYITDAIGRDSVVVSPTDSAQTTSLHVRDSLRYDIMDRVVESWSTGPATADTLNGIVHSTPALMQHVVNTYDARNLLSVMRDTSLSSLGQNTAATTIYTYDAAGRKLSQADHGPARRWTYDHAGNVLQDILPSGLTTLMGYDSLNRLTQRITPFVEGTKQGPNLTIGYLTDPIPDQHVHFPYFQQVLPDRSGYRANFLVAGDTATFSYDENGNLLAAYNRAARIDHQYYSGGLLKTERQRIAVFDTTTPLPAPGGTDTGSTPTGMATSLSLADVQLLTADSASFSSHEYVLQYEYDLSGRRTKLTDSSKGWPSLATQTYHYDSITGFADATTDQGTAFGLAYDDLGRLTGVTTGGGAVTESRQYDVDGRMISRSIGNRSGGVLDYTTGHDARGKSTSALVNGGASEIAAMTYNGLGALASLSRTAGTGSFDQYTSDALGNTISHTSPGQCSVVSQNTYDGERLVKMGRGPASTCPTDAPPPDPTAQTSDTTWHVYDADGNVVKDSTLSWTLWNGAWLSSPSLNWQGMSWTWNVYGGDNKLHVSQRTLLDNTGRRTVFTEYRYDALGRRVAVRTRVDSLCANPHPAPPACLSAMDRFVWDGDQLLYELRSDGSGSGNALEAEFSTVNSFYGKVRYTQAIGIDEPLAVWKNNGAAIIPHRGWRGVYEAASSADGLTVDTLTWPMAFSDVYFAPDARVVAPKRVAWLGSLLEGQTDPNGLMYMRNRYYDPKAGRFTQEDPAGLAGGANLYGFAGGDPVNHTDPFGLATDCLVLPCPVLLGAGSILGGVTAGTAAAVVAPIAVVGGLALWAAQDVNPTADGGVPGALVGSDATRVAPKHTPGEIADAVGESGATVIPHPTRTGQGTLIKWLDGSITDIRVETHPIPGSKGQPVKHGNVDTKDPSGKITKKHIPDGGGQP